MKDENDLVSPDEHVLRRINNKKDWYDPSLGFPVTRVACTPFKKDVDGLSVFRELFVSAAEVAAAGPNPDGYYVARLLVADIQRLGLTVVPNPLPGRLRGHAIIPELNYSATRSDPDTKKRTKELTFELAKLAGRNIVAEPNSS